MIFHQAQSCIIPDQISGNYYPSGFYSKPYIPPRYLIRYLMDFLQQKVVHF